MKKSEFETDITVHLIRIGSDIEHIKKDVAGIEDHLSKMNGRVRENEKSISGIKAVGGTLTVIIGAVLTWFGIDK